MLYRAPTNRSQGRKLVTVSRSNNKSHLSLRRSQTTAATTFSLIVSTASLTTTILLFFSIGIYMMTPSPSLESTLHELQDHDHRRRHRRQQQHHHRHRRMYESQQKNKEESDDEILLREFVFRSLMDNLPQVTALQSKNNKAIPIDKVVIYPTSHTDDNVPSVVDGVEEVVQSLLQQLQAEEQQQQILTEGQYDSTTTSNNTLRILLHNVDNSKLDPPQPHCSGTPFTYNRIQERLRGISNKNNNTSVKVQYVPREWKDKSFNSLNEVQRLMEFLYQHSNDPEYQDIQAVIVVSTPFHLPRSFLSALSSSVFNHNDVLSALSVFDREQHHHHKHHPPFLKVYAKAAKPRQASYWNRVVAHSQGTLVAARHDLISSELKRIHKYQEKGDLVSLEHALQLLQERDGAN
mmetsp:Transcript_15200/g.34688  ORF Transcript_15200/g.34688 Transcript_15200/m.34688 type:complete len:406 (+) Transcript_15200:104-1321(+)